MALDPELEVKRKCRPGSGSGYPPSKKENRHANSSVGARASNQLHAHGEQLGLVWCCDML